jgi:hypothetical protein
VRATISVVDERSPAQEAREAPSPEPHAWRWFVVWTAIGACASFGIVGLLSIGLPFLILAAVVAGWLLTRHPGSRVGAWGLVSGASVVVAFLAWVNRGGPGDVCSTDGNVTTCQQAWNPVPFAVVAVLLLGCGVTAFVLAQRRSRTTAAPGR